MSLEYAEYSLAYFGYSRKYKTSARSRNVGWSCSYIGCTNRDKLLLFMSLLRIRNWMCWLEECA